jgi:DNA-binding MarR family transcriptional regulator
VRKDDTVNRQLFLTAATTSELVARIVESRVAPVGIPGFLLALLTHVRDLAPVSPTGVSRASGVPVTTLRDNIRRLVERGLVVRVPNPDDGRSYLLVPTPRGTAIAAAAGETLLDAYLELERRLERPLAEMEAALEELNAALTGVVDASSPVSG